MSYGSAEQNKGGIMKDYVGLAENSDWQQTQT